MMKKRIITLSLTVALVLTTVFAGAQGVFAETSPDKSLGKNLVNSPAVSAQETRATLPTITAVNVNTAKYLPTYGIQFNKATPKYVAVKMPKAGMLEISVEQIAGQYGSSIKIKKSPSASASTIKSTYLSSSGDLEKTLQIQITKAGTYYIEFSTTFSSGDYKVAYNACYAPAGGTLTRGTTYIGASPSGTTSYYKVTAPSTGYFSISFPKDTRASAYASYRVKMTSSKKSSYYKDWEYVNSSKGYITYAGVPYGTYYIAVKASDPFYGIKVSHTKVTENSGSSKSTAKSFYKKGSTKKGVITASQGTTSGDWYKFKVTKTQKVVIQANGVALGSAYGGLKFSVYRSGRSTADVSANVYRTRKVRQLQLVSSGLKNSLRPGTYYIKVSKYSGGNGYYQLKWL